jgi:hypothetical protein
MAGRTIDTEELKKLLKKAKADPTFRDKLIGSAADTLRSEGLEPTDSWVDFFEGLSANNFEKAMGKAIETGNPGEAGL